MKKLKVVVITNAPLSNHGCSLWGIIGQYNLDLPRLILTAAFTAFTAFTFFLNSFTFVALHWRARKIEPRNLMFRFCLRSQLIKVFSVFPSQRLWFTGWCPHRGYDGWKSGRSCTTTQAESRMASSGAINWNNCVSDHNREKYSVFSEKNLNLTYVDEMLWDIFLTEWKKKK